jgi:hypothetical protein
VHRLPAQQIFIFDIAQAPDADPALDDIGQVRQGAGTEAPALAELGDAAHLGAGGRGDGNEDFIDAAASADFGEPVNAAEDFHPMEAAAPLGGVVIQHTEHPIIKRRIVQDFLAQLFPGVARPDDQN